MLDSDLAILYEVETKQLKRQVNRNMNRFPSDFMFELTEIVFESLRCQYGTSKIGRGGTRYLPMAFTEQGVAMLSSVLNSEKAISVNIHPDSYRDIRIFTRIRQMLTDNTELRLVIEELRKKTENNTKNIEVVFQYLDVPIAIGIPDKKENMKPREQIGYKISGK